MLTDTQFRQFLTYLPPEMRDRSWRAHTGDGRLLLFDRDSGLNILLKGPETGYFRQQAPRTLLIAVTNACNLACHFCYRDGTSRSLWRYESLLRFCREVDEWGVLEIAFGGGEPLLFPHWADFICELYTTTRLGLNFTTNGTLITESFLEAISGRYGQIRLSLYEDNHYQDTIKLLVRRGARFGVNWLITPDALHGMKQKLVDLVALGVRDFLLLGYKGSSAALHLKAEQFRQLAEIIQSARADWGHLVTFKLDACWGDSLPTIPRLFPHNDCGAGNGFLSISSDKRAKICSFQASSVGLEFETLGELRQIWEAHRRLSEPAQIGGCARLPDRGLGWGDHVYADIPLAAIQ